MKKIVCLLFSMFFFIIAFSNACNEKNLPYVINKSNEVCIVFVNETGQYGNSANCNVNIYNNTNGLFINNQVMTFRNTGIYFYNITNLTIGKYYFTAQCLQDNFFGSGGSDFEVVLENETQIFNIGLQVIDEQNTTNIWEEIKMIAIVLLIIIFLIMGITTNYMFWTLSGALFWLLSILDVLDKTFSQNYALNIFYILVGFILVFAGVIMHIGKLMKLEEETKPKSMYDNFY